VKRAIVYATSVGLGVCCALAGGARPAAAQSDWTMGGQNLANTRHQGAETVLGPDNVSGLRTKWVFTTGGDVSATPAVAGDAVYVPDWAGNLFKIDTRTGTQVWARRFSDYTGIPDSIARATPAVADGVLYVGSAGGYLLAVDAATGDLAWKTQVDPHPGTLLTAAPVVFQQRVYVGVSSKEELMALGRGYPCCTFRGSVVALDAQSGAIVWQSYTIPDNGGRPGGYAGNAIWGSTPVVDPDRRALYVATGNNYRVPADVQACEKARQADRRRRSCIVPDNHVDAVLALDLQTGAVRWSKKLQGYDAWNFACLGLPGRPRPKCPDPRGKDYDFGQGPMLFTAPGEPGRPLLGAGQKSGIFWALDPDTGTIVWSTVVGPAGHLGGLGWGSATDGSRIYATDANYGRKRYALVPSGETTRGGAWSALDAATGAIQWQTAAPDRATALGPLTVANGVVYAGSMARDGDNMFALDAATGQVLWRFASGGSVNAGPAVVNGTVYWGSGYTNLHLGSQNNKLYAFDLGR
jgi:polyvinyl alcohol dehydrogenase (cytochrome)